MTSPYLMTPRRPLWKALADTGRADYFRWTFKTSKGEIVLSVGKAHGSKDGMRHAASPDTCEALLWCKDRPRVDLAPEDISVLLEPWSRFFSCDDTGSPIATHMPDSILTALVFALDYYFERIYHGSSLINSFYHRAARLA